MITMNIKKSNKLVTTTKDCKCKIHEGAHYIFIDQLWYEQNQELLKRADSANKNGEVQQAILMMQEFSKQETSRIRAKEKGLDNHKWFQQEKQRRELYRMAGDF